MVLSLQIVELPDYSTENLNENMDNEREQKVVMDEERNYIQENTSSIYDQVTLPHSTDDAATIKPFKKPSVIIILLLIITYNVYSN